MILNRGDHALADPGRRALLRAAVAGAAAAGAGLTLGAAPATAAPQTPDTATRPATPDEALRVLAAGNRRWRRFQQRYPHESPAVRRALVSGQHPFAVILGCIESRVPPELVFDQGLGDLLTVRSAGEVLARNVGLVRARLAAEPDLADKVASKDLAIIGARYELHSQLVHTTH